jgi:hypothetical protein
MTISTSTIARPKGHSAVMAGRVEPPSSLDFFPTPPWATRALCECVLTESDWHGRSVWEPAAGEGHMADVLLEYFAFVLASDVHDYGRGHAIGSFTGSGPDVIEWDGEHREPDWTITNPPFNAAVDFAERALQEATHGVALLLRSAWIEGAERYNRLFSRCPPSVVAFFVERVPMVKGRWDPNASTATSYAWFVWRITEGSQPTQMIWIPPGQRKALEHPDDRRRFGPQEVAVS